jgi:hypothetical protein
VQANPNNSKQKNLDLLGFVWPKRDFSKGYNRKNKKICPLPDSLGGLSVSGSKQPQFLLLRP